MQYRRNLVHSTGVMTKVISSLDPDFGRMEALAIMGRAEFIGERYDEDGVLWRAYNKASGGYLDNPSMTIGDNFYANALRDYYDWEEKWWREAIQNSVDAGAKHIDCICQVKRDGTWIVSVSDDGTGMDEQTLLTKFFVLGASGKTAQTAGTVGGFGKAKELLVLPWLEWSISTQDNYVVGKGINYEIEKVSYRKGTTLQVVMPADRTTAPYHLTDFMSKCTLKGVRVTLNGEPVVSNLHMGKEIRNFQGKAVLYHDPQGQSRNGYVLVRANGVYMFQIYVSSDLEGTTILEILGPSVNILTANRDGIRDRELRDEVSQFTSKLASDVKSAMRDKKGLIRKKFVGRGKLSGANEQHFAELMNATLEFGKGKGRPILFSMGQMEKWAGIIRNRKSQERPEIYVPEGEAQDIPVSYEGGMPLMEHPVPMHQDTPSPVVSFKTIPEAIEAMISVQFDGPAHIEAAAKQLAWEPDYFIMNEIGDYKVPKAFFPATMSARILKLTRFWAEMCRFILIQLGDGKPFGVGYAFNEGQAGTYHVDDEGERWILLNPFHRALAGAEFYDLANWRDIQTIYSIAVHECTHHVTGITNHNEAFSSALTFNFAKTSGMDRHIRHILKFIRRRA